MGRGQREQEHLATLGAVLRDRGEQLDAPTLRDLGRAHRAAPDRAAGLQPLVGGRLVFLRPDHLDLVTLGAQPQAVSRAGVLEQLPGHGLKRKPLKACD
ncbi:hypothetical protein D3C87_1916270 [compost metagenome]